MRTLDEVRALIEAVSTEQILAVARRLRHSAHRYTLTAIGPRSAEELLGNEH